MAEDRGRGSSLRTVGLVVGTMLAIFVATSAGPIGAGPEQRPNLKGGIAFSELTSEGGLDLVVRDAGGANGRSLAAGPDDEFSPTWSPDRSWVAFVVNEGGSNANIHLSRADGSEAHVLVGTPATETGPAWSPTGEWIAYESASSEGRVEIFLVRPDGTGVRQVTNNVELDVQPEWSPDGTRLAVTRSAEGNGSEIVLLDIGTGAEDRLTDGTGGYADPAWSPDGLKIAVSKSSDGGLADLRLIELRSGSTNVVAEDVASIISDVSWTTDGAGLVFSAVGVGPKSGSLDDGLVWLHLPNRSFRHLGFGRGATVGW